MRVLCVNAGSSSLKLRLLGSEDEGLAELDIDTAGERIDETALSGALAEGLGEADAIGHRIVHGGERFTAAVRIDEGVEAELRRLAELAPLHQKSSLDALDAISGALPGVPAVACFDTAFHATLPPAASTDALPAPGRERFAIRRYGFHGLSHAWVARRAPELLGRAAEDLRIVSCHLGAGASLCAIEGGHSVDTTMGFTPLEGLVMATRSGSVDPGLLLWLLQDARLRERELAAGLEHDAGLKGLAGTPDMREVLAGADGSVPAARLARDVYIHRLRAAIAAMASSLQGIDVLAFTGGVGERSPRVRALAAAGLGFLGVGLDEGANDSLTADADLSAPGAPVRTVMIAAREDLEIARQVRAVLQSAGA